MYAYGGIVSMCRAGGEVSISYAAMEIAKINAGGVGCNPPLAGVGGS